MCIRDSPITAEGILPATLSGRHAAEAILAGDPASYPARLRRDPILTDYRRVHAALATVQRLRDRLSRWTGLASLVDRVTAGGAGAATPPSNGAAGNGAANGEHAPAAAAPAPTPAS